MGGSCFKSKTNPDDDLDNESSLWRIVKRGSRVIDPLLPLLVDTDHINLFDLLKEPIAQKALGAFASRISRDYVLMCWAEIEEYKGGGTWDVQKARAVDIYENYVKIGSQTRLLKISDEQEEKLRVVLSLENPSRTSGKDALDRPDEEKTLHSSFFAEVCVPKSSICTNIRFDGCVFM